MPNTTQTSLATSTSRVDTRRSIIDDHSEAVPIEGNVELGDRLVIEIGEGKTYDYEIVGIFEDDDKNSYAVAYSAVADEEEATDLAFVVTDANGKLLSDGELAQEVLDNFLTIAEESATEES